MICDAFCDRCECGLEEHPVDVPHHCETSDPQCGGVWFDHPTDPDRILVVRYPGLRPGGPNVERAARDGTADPIDGLIDEPRPMSFWQAILRAPRGPIRFMTGTSEGP